jgi:cellulose synthase/poly-beta-1,6-N-acetylglucosamine synthase-like glycosyltransferase
MNVVALLPTLSAGGAAVESWRRILTDNDTLHLITFGDGDARKVAGVDVHYLSLRDRQGGRRLICGVGHRLVTSGVGFWGPYVEEIWPELVWNIRCFDPDVVDLRWIKAQKGLRDRLSEMEWDVIATERHLTARKEPETRRVYDPNQKVSIVLPVYNGESYLRQSIESCLEQSHRNIELVIVDDCSKDDSPAIIDSYARRDSRIIKIRNTRNRRLPGALNVGFAATSGDLLTWTSHDNYYAPTAVEALVRYLCTWPDVDLVYSAYHVVDDVGRIRPDVEYLPAPERLRFKNVIGAYFLHRRNVYERIGNYREDMEYAEDYEYWVRVYKAGFNIMRLHLPLYYYRHHGASMTAEADAMLDKPHIGDQVRREHFA